MALGADIKKYRKALKLSQDEFARKLGLSQATLSLTESEKIKVSDTVIKCISAEFNKPTYTPRFEEFCQRIDSERQLSQTLVGNALVNHATLPVWLWEDGFDLASAPSSLEWRGVVTVRAPSNESIAFEMPKGSGAWVAGEVLVFRLTTLDNCKGDELCLIQYRRRERVSTTLIATLRRDPSARRRLFSLEPGNPEDESFAVDPDRIDAILRCVYRARYLE